MQKLKSFLGIQAYITFSLLFSLTVLFIIWKLPNHRVLLLLIILTYQYYFAKRNEMFVKFIKWCQPINFFDGSSIEFEEIPDDSKCMLCFHPHGVFAFSMVLNSFSSDTLKQFKILGSSLPRNIPILGIIYRLFDLQGVNPSNLNRLMNQGSNILMLPGGFEEASLTQYGKQKIYINDRKGFIKYALKYGYKVYPVYAFGETSVYYTFSALESLRLMLNKFKIPGTLFFSKYVLPFIPHSDQNLNTVVGKPIQFPQIQKPDQNDIDKFHQLYIQKIKELYEKKKNQFNVYQELQLFP